MRKQFDQVPREMGERHRLNGLDRKAFLVSGAPWLGKHGQLGVVSSHTCDCTSPWSRSGRGRLKNFR